MNGPTVCDPTITILIAAFLTLSVFVGFLAAFTVVDKLSAYRARRLQELHKTPSRRNP